MKVLVTGSSGYIGQQTAAELKNRGHSVVPYDISEGQDIHDKKRLAESMKGCDAVAHLAAIPHAKGGVPWEDYFTTNVLGSQKVASVTAHAGVPHLIQVSSTSYYGAHKGFPFDPDDGLEPDSPNAIQRYMGKDLPDMSKPYNPAALAYTMSKIAAETCVAAFGMSERIKRVTVLRFFPSPKTRQPYNWGLFMSPETGAKGVADAVESEGKGFEVKMVYDLNPHAET